MPTWKDFRRYLERNGWECCRKTKHYYYRKRLNDGDYLFTVCSFGSGEIPRRRWQYILKYELKITQEEFNAGL